MEIGDWRLQIGRIGMTPDELSDRLIDFGVRAGRVVDALPDTRLGRHIAGQLVRCGTSPAPNYDEGSAAASRDDFIHKVGIACKEVRETAYWLTVIKRSGWKVTQLEALLSEAHQLAAILSASSRTARANVRKEAP